jgi:hypothetical protein
VPVEIGENKEGNAFCRLIEPPDRFLEAAEPAAPVAISDQVVSPGLSQDRANRRFAKDIFNRKTD